MTKLLRIAAAGLIGVILALSVARAGDAGAEKAAVAAADAWLAQVDAGKFAASWDEAAKIFQRSVPKAQWEQAVGAVRVPLGKVVSRAFARAHYTESLPGAPDGKYVVIQYATTFENKKAAVETVTPALDPDGRWRVSGYYVK
jgi:hypothetical protein